MSHLTPAILPLLLATLGAQAQPGGDAPAPVAVDRLAVGARLLAAVDEIAGKLGDVGTTARLVLVATTTADELPAGSLVGSRLRALAAGGGADEGDEKAAARLARELAGIAGDLRFQPLREAPGPAGWPEFTPVGDIEVKTYPTYRMARSTMRGANSMGAFWNLFEHIQTKSIPMTAPVQVDYAAAADEDPAPASMAFLYEHADKGSTGIEGRVEVVDVPAVTVLSIGARGSDSRLRVEQLREKLEDWLRAHHATHRVAGPMRTMGWNSPSVRGDRRYFEVQIPVVTSL